MNSLLRCVRQMSPERETYPLPEKSFTSGLRTKGKEVKYSDYYILNSPTRKSLGSKPGTPTRLSLYSSKKRSSNDLAKEVLRSLETDCSLSSAKRIPHKYTKKSPDASSPSYFSRYSQEISVSTAASKKYAQDSMQQLQLSFDEDFSTNSKILILKENQAKSELEYKARVQILQENIKGYEKLCEEEIKRQEIDKKSILRHDDKPSYEDLSLEVKTLREENSKLRKVIAVYKNNETITLKNMKERLLGLNKRLEN